MTDRPPIFGHHRLHRLRQSFLHGKLSDALFWTLVVVAALALGMASFTTSYIRLSTHPTEIAP